MRRIVEPIFYGLRAGCAWEMLPDDFPPVPTVYRWFARFHDHGTWEAINHHPVMHDRERVKRAGGPSASAARGIGGPDRDHVPHRRGRLRRRARVGPGHSARPWSGGSATRHNARGIIH